MKLLITIVSIILKKLQIRQTVRSSQSLTESEDSPFVRFVFQSCYRIGKEAFMTKSYSNDLREIAALTATDGRQES